MFLLIAPLRCTDAPHGEATPLASHVALLPDAISFSSLNCLRPLLITFISNSIPVAVLIWEYMLPDESVRENAIELTESRIFSPGRTESGTGWFGGPRAPWPRLLVLDA